MFISDKFGSAILIAFRNWQEKCLFKLNDRVLDLIKRYGKLNSSDIVEISLCKAEKEMLLHEYDNVSKKCRRFAELWFKGKKIKKSMKDEYSEVLKNIELMKSSLNNIIIK